MSPFHGTLGRIALVMLLAATSSCGVNKPDDAASNARSSELQSVPMRASIVIQSDWGGGFCANVVVSNLGSVSTASWTVVLDLKGSAINSIWGARRAQTAAATATATVTPESWSAVVAPNAATSFGFCANSPSRERPVVVSASGTSNSPPVDAGSDTGADTSVDTDVDSGIDSDVDTDADAGEETGSDAVADVGEEAGSDAGADTGEETGSDTGADTGTPDTGDPGPTCSWGAGRSYSSASLTWYYLAQGSNGAVACSFAAHQSGKMGGDWIEHASTGGGQFFVAMNTADYRDAAACGACVEITREDDGRHVVATVVDECPSSTNPACVAGHLDLSVDAYRELADPDTEGCIGPQPGCAPHRVSWKFVPCPVTENVSFRLKEPSNQWWNQILVQGTRTPVAKVEAFVDGAWRAGVRTRYNYWQVGNGYLGNAPYRVRVTDTNGKVVEAHLHLKGGDQMASSQFPVCR